MNPNSNLSNDQNQNNSVLRKRTREPRMNEDIMKVINCHQCKKVDTSINMLTCANSNCRESFCFDCVKGYYSKFNSQTYINLKELEESKKWLCYRCKKKCLCKECENNFNNYPVKLMRKKRRKNKILNKKIIFKSNKTIAEPQKKEMIIDQNKIKESIKVDDYFVYEYEGSNESMEPENEMQIHNEEIEHSSGSEKKKRVIKNRMKMTSSKKFKKLMKFRT